MRHAMQPPVQAPLLPEASGLPGQNGKRRLRGILGVVVIAQQSETRPIDHRSIPRHKLRKSGPVAACDVTFEECLVGFQLR